MENHWAPCDFLNGEKRQGRSFSLHPPFILHPHSPVPIGLDADSQALALERGWGQKLGNLVTT